MRLWMKYRLEKQQQTAYHFVCISIIVRDVEK